MKKSPIVILFSLLGIIALIAGVQSIGGPAGSTTKAKAAGTAVSTNHGRGGTKAWSAAAMAAAKPMRMPTPKAGSGGPVARADGPAGAIASQGPSGSALASSAGASVDGPSAQAGSFTYPTPFDRYQVPVRTSFPHSTVGKVFFNQNGGSFVCSASVIAESSIWLAGHCVSDGAGHFSSNLTFAPQYDNGSRPKGTFSCPTLFVLTSWHTTHNFRQDEGIAVCGRNSAGQTPRAAVGRLGFAWNQPQPKHYNSLGYPQASPFNGATMQQCQSSFGHFDSRIGGSGPTPFAIGCDMTGGSSGGPWIYKYVPGIVGANNYLNGHNDYKYTTPNEPLEMYSPYFDNASRNLLCTATELC